MVGHCAGDLLFLGRIREPMTPLLIWAKDVRDLVDGELHMPMLRKRAMALKLTICFLAELIVLETYSRIVII